MALTQKELTSGTFTATLQDQNGDTITSGITVLEMSLYDQDGNVINTVDDVNILNTGRGTLTAGVLKITFEPADHTISGTAKGLRRHLLKIFYKWDGGDKQAYDETYFSVENFSQAAS